MRENKVTVWLSLSTVLTAVAASLCCILPLSVALLGAGSAALGTQLAPWRPLFLVATVALLGFAFYREYRRSAASAEEACCRPAAVRRRRSMLWVITVLILGLSAFPYYMPTAMAGRQAGAGAAGGEEVARVAFRVEGMTCSGCEATTEMALKELPGIVSVKVSYDESRADITYRPSQVGVQDMKKAIEKLGYKAERIAPSAEGTEPASARPAPPAVKASTSGGQAAALRDLQGLDDLAGVFRQTRGKPRLVLLLSPT